MDRRRLVKSADDGSVKGQLIDIGGRRLHMVSEGDGCPAVVLDAALGASSLSWSHVQPLVARVTRACTYDRAGFGWSDPGPLPRTANRVADELHQLLRCADVPPPYVLVGHSYGGLVMRLFAARHPGAIEREQIARGSRLCRYGASAARRGLARVVAGLVVMGRLRLARSIVRLVSRGGLRPNDENILSHIWKLPQDARDALRHTWTQPKFFEALGSQIETMSESANAVLTSSADGFGDLPLAVLTASDEREARLRADAALAGRSTRGRHVLVPGTSHWIPLDAPLAVSQAIIDLVQEIRRCQLT
jgi:pimeloyl-ACP methyl ester carboxylesterase